MQDGESQAARRGSAAAPAGSALRGSLRRDIALLATPTLFQSLRHALETTGFVVHSPPNFVEHCCVSIPDAIIIEATDELEPVAEVLLGRNALGQTPFIFIGPISVDGIDNRKITELSADVSVPEVARVCRAACQGTVAGPLSPPAAQPSSPFRTLPREDVPPSETPASVPGAASLLLASSPTSSHPPRSNSAAANLRWGDTDPPLTPERSPTAFSPDLARIIAIGEEKAAAVMEHLDNAELKRASAERTVEVRSEVLEALALPLGGQPKQAADSSPALPADGTRSRPITTEQTARRNDSLADLSERNSGMETGASESVSSAAADSDAQSEAPTTNAPSGFELPQPPMTQPTPSEKPSAGDTGTTSQRELTDAERQTEPPPRNRNRRRSEVNERSSGRAQGTLTTDPNRPLTDQGGFDAAPKPDLDDLAATNGLAIPPAPALPQLTSGASRSDLNNPYVPTEAPQRSAQNPRSISTLPPNARVTDAPGTINSYETTARMAPSGAIPTQHGAEHSIDHPELRRTDAARLVARAIREGWTGSAVFEDTKGVRRLILSDGDIVTAVSGVKGESLLAYLVTIGQLEPRVQQQLEHKLPTFGRHAGAALVATGHLGQHELWPVLRSHAEFVVGQCLSLESGSGSLETSVPERLRAEPSVFGGSAGAEVFVETLRRVMSPANALECLGGAETRWARGTNHGILEECGLSAPERKALSAAFKGSIADTVGSREGGSIPSTLWALFLLGVLKRETQAQTSPTASVTAGSVEATNLRERIAIRRRLVDDGDYFTLLGLSRKATSYDVERAYHDLKEQFDPGIVLTPSTLDLSDDVSLILDVLDEAYAVLAGSTQRERYRRALESFS